MTKPIFVKTVIAEVENAIPPGAMNTFSTVGDINGDGWLDYVICGRNGRMVWLENRGAGGEWQVHHIDEPDRMECGGSLVDLTGNGRLDVINGSDWRSDEIFWWENPGKPDIQWKKRLIAKTGKGQFHDTLIGDVTNDGQLSLVFTNQGNATDVYCIPLPQDATASPWSRIERIASGMSEENPRRSQTQFRQPEEGLAIGDVDGDGLNELICGTHWYKYRGPGIWEQHKFTSGYITTKIAIGDLDGDGRNEIVLSEGDPCVYGRTEGGKLAWFKPGADVTALWQEHLLDQNLLDPHSLQLADLCGNGRLDIFVGEVGMADPQTDAYITRQPRLMVYENDGQGGFTRHIIDEGTGTHDAQLADLYHTGRLDIIGKPLHGPEKWKVHAWLNRGS